MVKTYDNYICVMPAADAILIANTLANLGMALEGLTLIADEGDAEGELFRITPKQIHTAWKAANTALHHNWLGADDE